MGRAGAYPRLGRGVGADEPPPARPRGASRRVRRGGQGSGRGAPPGGGGALRRDARAGPPVRRRRVRRGAQLRGPRARGRRAAGAGRAPPRPPARRPALHVPPPEPPRVHGVARARLGRFHHERTYTRREACGCSSAQGFGSRAAARSTSCPGTCGDGCRGACRWRPGPASPTIAWTPPSRGFPASGAWRRPGPSSRTGALALGAAERPRLPGADLEETSDAERRIRRVRSETLEIGYEEHGRSDAPAVVLLHGFPDDARAWDEIVPRLVEAGHRAIVPYLRGYGPTRLLDPSKPRMAQQAALAQDLVDLLDALGLDRVSLVGQDWGSRTVCIAAALHPQRVRALVSIGGYTIQDIAGMAAPGRRPTRRRGSGTSGTSTPSAAGPVSPAIDGRSAGISGGRGHRAGGSTRPRSIAPSRPSRTPTSWTS